MSTEGPKTGNSDVPRCIFRKFGQVWYACCNELGASGVNLPMFSFHIAVNSDAPGCILIRFVLHRISSCSKLICTWVHLDSICL
ncbi:hypothetical protein C5167_027634 [Papaver somniferum]|nr:hypothetical protein C5167_027634 [Papaver somniferum]